MTSFLLQDTATRREILETISAETGRSAGILEKDVWIVWTLDRLFALPDRPRLAFKGGTSLSKAYGVIDRFSEDVDVSLHFGDGADGADPHAGEMSRTQIRKLSEKLRDWVSCNASEIFVPYLRSETEKLLGTPLQIQVDESGERLTLHYPSALEERDQYHREYVLIELGGRNEAEPSERHELKTYLSEHVVTLEFPVATVDVLAIQRTFWEKVTAIHDHNLWQRPDKCDAFSRHLSDVVQLWKQRKQLGLLDDLALLERVCHHKKLFWARGHSDYDACTAGRLRLLPEGAVRAALKADYQRSVNAGMYFHDPESFDQLIDALAEIETTINAATTAEKSRETEPVIDSK